ncbi:MAG: UDP-glucose/GDP-mannose dehydrogenase [Cyanobacteria bacterium RYN_339]|nr:UDP-glucose/GDP-mannose dehydrogenase [Cyanobacteria bacterium RYN_339]
MKISIFGMGYVGAVTAACFARDGHEVLGVDTNPAKVATIARGESPIVEAGLKELLAEGVRVGRIRGTTDPQQAVQETDVSLVSVGTPATDRGAPDLRFVFDVCRQIGEAVALKGRAHVVIIRSTVPPGTLARCREILEEAAQGVPVHAAFNPEFLREGAAIKDYDEAAYTIVGTDDPAAEAAVREIYAKVPAPVIVVEPAVAEMVKYVSNTWHAAKVTFANEVGLMANAFGVNGRDVMKIIVQDTKLNVSPVYMRPGYAYGGSCLPKDLSALLHFAQAKGISTPLFRAIPESNANMIAMAAAEVFRLKARRVAVFGLAFKAGTDDLRESPAVPLVKRLLGEGCEVRIYDPSVTEAGLMGANLHYIHANVPHFQRLMQEDPLLVLEGADLVIVTYSSPEFREALEHLPAGTAILDLAGLYAEAPVGKEYHALCW